MYGLKNNEYVTLCTLIHITIAHTKYIV